MPFLSLSYSGGYSNNEVGYGSPYGYSASVTPQQTMQYDISADYVDSTTYEPRSTPLRLYRPVLHTYMFVCVWVFFSLAHVVAY